MRSLLTPRCLRETKKHPAKPPRPRFEPWRGGEHEPTWGAERGPEARSFPAGRRAGGGRVETDHGLRFLVGQPEDQVVGGCAVEQRVLLVPGQRLHLGGGLGGDARGPRLSCLAGTGSWRGRSPRSPPRSTSWPAFVAARRASSAAAKWPLRNSAMPRASSSRVSLAEFHGLASEGQHRFEFRRVGRWTQGTGLCGAARRHRVVGPLGEREDPPPGRGIFLVLPEPHLKTGDVQELAGSFCRAEPSPGATAPPVGGRRPGSCRPGLVMLPSVRGGRGRAWPSSGPASPRGA